MDKRITANRFIPETHKRAIEELVNPTEMPVSKVKRIVVLTLLAHSVFLVMLFTTLVVIRLAYAL